MSCQVRKWRAAGAAAAQASAECRAAQSTPAKKEIDSRFADLLAARAAQDAQWTTSLNCEGKPQCQGPPTQASSSFKYTYAGR